ncbi:MAG TPA: VOC family protein [Herpetosiphonaceae bacterium]
MSYYGVNHLALRVVDLRQAESFYCTLFALEVLFREAEHADGWRTLPTASSWDDAIAAGIDLGLSMLQREGFTLALEAQSAIMPDGTLSHIGLHVDRAELAELRRRAALLGCTIVADRPDALIIDDPYGVRWEVMTRAHVLSTSERTGVWLELG